MDSGSEGEEDAIPRVERIANLKHRCATAKEDRLKRFRALMEGSVPRVV